MWITILGMFISSVVSVILSDKIIFALDRLFIRLRISKSSNITGLWKATFIMGYGKTKKEFEEIIFLKKKFGTIYGYIADDTRNYERLQTVMNKEPLRLKGFLSDNRYFTGFWYHPIETYRYHGSFQLLIKPNFIKMEGQWIGYSESKQIINNGAWIWEKLNV
ncbi:hypothetical protein [uncultured Clostridium sp.]|uniref:hypothetical protein n=1 Tax=uncultured Clostridium sp. TaxID=59620 RepID=UPI00272EAEEB|nr:hypothetical protein [uncultured Clostridium sp.]